MNVYEKILALGGFLPLARGYIHVCTCMTMIFKHFSQKLLGQSKPNFIWSILRKGNG